MIFFYFVKYRLDSSQNILVSVWIKSLYGQLVLNILCNNKGISLVGGFVFVKFYVRVLFVNVADGFWGVSSPLCVERLMVR